MDIGTPYEVEEFHPSLALKLLLLYMPDGCPFTE
jgi:hypothetical protein